MLNEATHLVMGQISFPINLASELTTTAHIVYLNAAESQAPTSGPCAGGSATAPTKVTALPNGTLCVFTGKEENNAVEYEGIQNASGTGTRSAPRASATGGSIVFKASGEGARVLMTGSWVVRAP
jgi:hypothetical protein